MAARVQSAPHLLDSLYRESVCKLLGGNEPVRRLPAAVKRTFPITFVTTFFLIAICQ